MDFGYIGGRLSIQLLRGLLGEVGGDDLLNLDSLHYQEHVGEHLDVHDMSLGLRRVGSGYLALRFEYMGVLRGRWDRCEGVDRFYIGRQFCEGVGMVFGISGWFIIVVFECLSVGDVRGRGRELWFREYGGSDNGTKEKNHKGITSHNNHHHHTCHKCPIKELIDQGVVDALAARDTDRSQNGDDSHNSGTGSTEGVAGLSQWFERIEYVFHISNCAVENQVKFATCTLHSVALTWWNTHVKTVGHDVAYRVAIAYTNGSGERKEYAGTLPLCNKCKFHQNGQCTVKCANCKRVGHLTRDCRSPAVTNNQRNPTCYECGNQGYYRSDCPKIKNQNHGNQTGGTGARVMVHALGGGEINQDLNNMDDDINA
ncbi:reverse transcriptase domain-containing protein [Tanacetum coccineum]